MMHSPGLVELVAALTYFVHCLKLWHKSPSDLLASPATSAIWLRQVRSLVTFPQGICLNISYTIPLLNVFDLNTHVTRVL